jgi:hypothetical protein
MERYAIEIETSAGWVQYHLILRPGEERARFVIDEVREKFPASRFRLVKWTGTAVDY